jgi:hypothetical protein
MVMENPTRGLVEGQKGKLASGLVRTKKRMLGERLKGLRRVQWRIYVHVEDGSGIGAKDRSSLPVPQGESVLA